MGLMWIVLRLGISIGRSAGKRRWGGTRGRWKGGQFEHGCGERREAAILHFCSNNGICQAIALAVRLRLRSHHLIVAC